tara:strand:+ start:236 stop:574 length:339 start_codon:yes stop_codon:yes gene_type:complete
MCDHGSWRGKYNLGPDQDDNTDPATIDPATIDSDAIGVGTIDPDGCSRAGHPISIDGGRSRVSIDGGRNQVRMAIRADGRESSRTDGSESRSHLRHNFDNAIKLQHHSHESS